MCDIDINQFCTKVEQLFSVFGIASKMGSFVSKLHSLPKNEIFRKDTSFGYFWLISDMENKFFLQLLGEISIGQNLTKYTSSRSLDYICGYNQQSMTSLVGMNDSEECLYASHYMEQRGYDRLLSDSEDIQYGTMAYITSFTDKEDDLTMWRLYGDDAKGIALNFCLNNDLSNNFYLAHVSYAKEDKQHPELELLLKMMEITIGECKFCFKNLYLWRFFFKPYDYKIEDEIRLLYFVDKNSKKTTWIKSASGIYTPIIKFPIVDETCDMEESPLLYPLTLSKVTLGPQFVEAEKNRETISQMFKTRFGWTQSEFQVVISSISNYKNL